MELLPLGGSAAQPTPPQTETPSPAPTQAQTPPAAGPSSAPLYDTNAWRRTAPPAQAAPIETPRIEGSKSSTPTFGAIALVVLSLVAGGFRAYNRQQMREERRSEEARQQQAEDAAQTAQQNNVAIERSMRAANAERQSYGQSARPAFSQPLYAPARRTNFPAPGGMANRDGFTPPSPQLRALLLSEAARYANGRTVARTVISTTGNGLYQAAVTYNTGDVSQFRYDGTAWAVEGGSAPVAATGAQPGQPVPMGQSGQPVPAVGGNGYGQPGNNATPGSGGAPYNGTGGGIANPANGTAAPGGGTNAPGGYIAPGSAPQNTGANPASGGTNPNGNNPPASNPEPGAPPAGG